MDLDEEELNKVLAEHSGMVRYFAQRWNTHLPSGLGIEDLCQVGNIALLEAVARFTPDRGATFRSYAQWRVNGAMGDEIRRMRWVCRHMKSEELMKLIDLRRLQGLPVTIEALAEVTGHSVEKLREWEMRVLIATTDHVSLDVVAGLDDAGGPLQVADSAPDALARLEARERTRVLHAAIDELPDRMRTVLNLHYFEDMTMREAGDLLGVTESRISQILTQAEKRLKEALAVVPIDTPVPYSVIHTKPVSMRECPRCHVLYTCNGFRLPRNCRNRHCGEQAGMRPGPPR